MQGHKKISIPFKETLVSSFELAKNNNQRLVIYTGYLLNTQQMDIIVKNIAVYKDNTEDIIVDPICGNNNKAYINSSTINNFYKLLEIADIITPNKTELLLLFDSFDSSFEELIKKITAKFHSKKIVITSVIDKRNSYNTLVSNYKLTLLPFEVLKNSYSGTKYLFAVLFIKFYFFDSLSAKTSVIKSAENINSLIQKNITLKTESYNLLISPFNPFNIMKTGTLFYVVGASGVGKDTLLYLAKKTLANSDVRFPKRYITRSSEAGGEDHMPISREGFLKKIDDSFFSLWWHSHNKYYGISNHINSYLAQGVNVVINGSRGYYGEALKKYPNMKTILITASEDTIRKRLTKRGRETKEEIEKRIKRTRKFNSFLGNNNLIILNNDTSLEVSGQKFIDILSQ